MEHFTIIPLRVGDYVGLEHTNFTYGHNQGKKLPCPIIAYLLRSRNMTVLVDTGPSSEEETRKNRHTPLTQTEDQRILNALKKHGATPETIDAVIMTHLHYDHCYGMFHFTRQPIYIQRREWEYALNPLPCHYVVYESQLAGYFPPFLREIDKLRTVLVDGEKELVPGLTLVPLPGHTPGMQGVLVAARGGNRLIASDAVPIFENWEQYTPPLPSGLHVDLVSYYQTLERIASYNCPILPGHDARVFELYGPDG
ncbi:MAG: N-acyl homoserine lactonase family protein [Desulfovibrio sp.]|jgi:glyoxylase-like metal-dependent hydrolase (beta-lactamase superfamily II)|nr:N-acyl homoserine lactonase family protein [Desulfovibrio sp.]